MSESGDSLEDFVFKETDLNETSALSQTSSETISSDQRLESESSTINMTKPTDQVKTVLLNDLEFELAWETRDAIIANLSQHSKLLSGLVIEQDARKKIQKANTELNSSLMNLHLKKLEAFGGTSDSRLDEVVLDLKWEVRSRVMELLATNHNIALLESDSVTSECKSKLIDQNNDLACELLKLRSRTIAISGDSSESNEDHLIDQTAKEKLQPLKLVEQSVATLKEELEMFKIASNKTNDLAKMVGSLKDRLDASEGANFCRNTTTFTFELKDVNALLNDAERPKRCSEFFYCSGLPWFLSVQTRLTDGVDCLAVYLYHANNIADQWSILATYEIRLLSSTSSAIRSSDVVSIGKDKKFKNPDEFQAWGLSTFITLDRLRTGSFIQNDTIKIRVNLSTKNYERICP